MLLSTTGPGSGSESTPRILMVIDSDKNMETGIVKRDFVHRHALHELEAGFLHITDAELQERRCTGTAALLAWLEFGLDRGYLTRREHDGVLACTSRKAAGTFRIILKMHKTPLKSRPICNLSAPGSMN